MRHTLTKTVLVVLGATMLSTLAVRAFDMRTYLPTSFLASLFSVTVRGTQPCPNDMRLVEYAEGAFCVDMYEASPSRVCAHAEPASALETQQNLTRESCKSVSSKDSIPWRFVTLHDARALCARAGKRLPTASEWYSASLGTPDSHKAFTQDGCNVARNRGDGASRAGSGKECVSEYGVYDMVGNVWEWVEEEVVYGVWKDKTLPQSGFVQSVDLHGIAQESGDVALESLGYDRVWSDVTLHAGMMRGGYYDSKSAGGLYATHIASPLDFSGDAVGFRCVQSVLSNE